MADEVNPRLLEAFAEQQCQIVGISDELLDGHPRLWLPRRKPDSRTALVPDHDSEMLFQSGNVVLTHHPLAPMCRDRHRGTAGRDWPC